MPQILIKKVPSGFDEKSSREQMVGLVLPTTNSDKEFFHVPLGELIETLKEHGKIGPLAYWSSFSPKNGFAFFHKEDCELL